MNPFEKNILRAVILTEAAVEGIDAGQVADQLSSLRREVLARILDLASEYLDSAARFFRSRLGEAVDDDEIRREIEVRRQAAAPDLVDCVIAPSQLIDVVVDVHQLVFKLAVGVGSPSSLAGDGDFDDLVGGLDGALDLLEQALVVLDPDRLRRLLHDPDRIDAVQLAWKLEQLELQVEKFELVARFRDGFEP